MLGDQGSLRLRDLVVWNVVGKTEDVLFFLLCYVLCSWCDSANLVMGDLKVYVVGGGEMCQTGKRTSSREHVSDDNEFVQRV